MLFRSSKLKNVYLVSCEAYPEENVIVSHIINDSLTSITKLDYDIPLNLPTDNQSVVLEDEKNWWKIASMYSPKFDQETMEIPIRGEGVRVYVVDSGIEATHPEFDGRTIVNLYSFTGDFTDTAGHGTAMASLISGKTCGLTDATICVVKIFDHEIGRAHV